nr:hypothetical protein [Streptomyces sp. HNM0574]
MLGGSLLGASSVQADILPAQPGQQADRQQTTEQQSQANLVPAKPYGTVIASALNVRQYPSTDSTAKGLLKKGQHRGLDCKVNAQNIGGNTIWYKLRGAPERWVTARYVDNHGHVMLCKDKYPSSLSKSPESQNAVG